MLRNSAHSSSDRRISRGFRGVGGFGLGIYASPLIVKTSLSSDPSRHYGNGAIPLAQAHAGRVRAHRLRSLAMQATSYGRVRVWSIKLTGIVAEKLAAHINNLAKVVPRCPCGN